MATLTIMNNFFLGQGMIPAGLGVDGQGSKKGDVKDDSRAMKEAKNLGERIVELLKTRSKE